MYYIIKYLIEEILQNNKRVFSGICKLFQSARLSTIKRKFPVFYEEYLLWNSQKVINIK